MFKHRMRRPNGHQVGVIGVGLVGRTRPAADPTAKRIYNLSTDTRVYNGSTDFRVYR